MEPVVGDGVTLVDPNKPDDDDEPKTVLGKIKKVRSVTLFVFFFTSY